MGTLLSRIFSLISSNWLDNNFFAIGDDLRVKIAYVVLTFYQLKINPSVNITNPKGKFLICVHFHSVGKPHVRTFEP